MADQTGHMADSRNDVNREVDGIPGAETGSAADGRIRRMAAEGMDGQNAGMSAADDSSERGRIRRQPLYRSFGYAFEGVGTCIRSERNMKIHCTAAVLVVVFGIWLKISVTEWCICLILFGLVMGLEMVNTAVESVVDLVTKERRPLAKKAKDTAAGAVLIAAIMAAIAGCIIFLPKLRAVLISLQASV